MQKINHATGVVERKLAPLRDAAAVGVGLYAGAQILFGSPVMDHLPEAVALGLSFLSHGDRTNRVEAAVIRRQVAQNRILSPEGLRGQEAHALGIFGPDVPEQFPERDFLTSTSTSYSLGATPGFSYLRNLRGLAMTLDMIFGVMRRSHVYTEGLWKTFLSWLESVRPGHHAPVSEKYLAAVNILLPQWAMRLAKRYGISLSFHEMERLKSIPEGAPTIFAAFPHSSIYPDFLFWSKLPRARFVASLRNFHDHPVMRAISIAWFLDVIGLPYVSRKRAVGNDRLYDRTTDRMEKYGIMPVFFPQAGRAPAAFKDSGEASRPGLYSNVVNPEHPERYYNLRGTVGTALAAAERMGQPAHIPILFIKGAGRIMPKGSGRFTLQWARRFLPRWVGSFIKILSQTPPFIQPVQPGEVSFSIGEIVKVEPGANQEEIERQVIEAAKRVTKINDKLEREVRRWAGQVETPLAGENFRKLADADERLYVIADRIRSVHPNDETIDCGRKQSTRMIFKRRLAEILMRAIRDEDVNDSINSLLADVSKVVKETEYY